MDKKTTTTLIGLGAGAIVGGVAGYLIYPPRTGDINGDGTVDTGDIQYLTWHIAGIEGYEKVHADPDINCDGLVNDDDVAYLSLHLAGDPAYKQLYPCPDILSDKRTMYIAGGAAVGGIALGALMYFLIK